MFWEEIFIIRYIDLKKSDWWKQTMSRGCWYQSACKFPRYPSVIKEKKAQSTQSRPSVCGCRTPTRPGVHGSAHSLQPGAGREGISNGEPTGSSGTTSNAANWLIRPPHHLHNVSMNDVSAKCIPTHDQSPWRSNQPCIWTRYRSAPAGVRHHLQPDQNQPKVFASIKLMIMAGLSQKDICRYDDSTHCRFQWTFKMNSMSGTIRFLR